MTAPLPSHTTAPSSASSASASATMSSLADPPAVATPPAPPPAPSSTPAQAQMPHAPPTHPPATSHPTPPQPQPFYASAAPLYHPAQPQHHPPPPYPSYQSPPPFPYPSPQFFQQQPMYQVPPTWHAHAPVHPHPSSPPFPSAAPFYAWPPQPPHAPPHHPNPREHSPSPRHRRRHPDPARPSVRNRHASPRATRRILHDAPSTPKSDRYAHPDHPTAYLDHEDPAAPHPDSNAASHHSVTTPTHTPSRRASRRRANTVNNSNASSSNGPGSASTATTNGTNRGASNNANSNISSATASAPSSGQNGTSNSHAAASPTKNSTNRPHGTDNSEKDTIAASAELDRAAKKAVESADEVTLALLLTSWANSLAEAQQHGGGAASHFETVFHGSQALEIVFGDVLLMDIPKGSAVRKALISLLGFVLYGDENMHHAFADHIAALNVPLESDHNADMRSIWTEARSSAIKRFLSFLRTISNNLRAYVEVLPLATTQSELAKPRSPVGGGPQSSSGPAGPDPTKAVERSMDGWRRAVARLQGEMAIIVVLKNALASVDTELQSTCDIAFLELQHFYEMMRATLKAFLAEDIERRTAALNLQYWSDVTGGADTTVFEAARSRANMWLNQFETSRQEVESQLDDAGIGFGPSARVSEDKFSVLVSASAGVAALVSCHQHSFSWAKDTARLLCSMITAFHALENMSGGSLSPSDSLKATFFNGLADTFTAIDNVVNWSFASLHDKVLGSLEKSTADPMQVGDTQPQKSRSLRFEEPPKTPSKGGSESTDGGVAPPQSRRKPRHARMKSSPDALLHLNAHFDDYSDTENELDREIDREIDHNEDREAELGNYEETGMPRMLTPKRALAPDVNADKGEVSRKRGDDELPVVYEGQPLEYGSDDEDEDDRDIVVHDDLEDATKPKKVSHTSHVRSMSVDGIPF